MAKVQWRDIRFPKTKLKLERHKTYMGVYMGDYLPGASQRNHAIYGRSNGTTYNKSSTPLDEEGNWLFHLLCLFHLEHININVVTLQKHVYRIDQNVQVHEQGSHLTYTNLPLINGAIVCRWHGCPGWPICILRLDTTIICWIILRLGTAATGQVLWLDTCAACVCRVRLSMRAVGAGVLHLKSFTTRITLTWINLWNR